MTGRSVAALMVAGVVGAAVVAGLTVLGPPSEERARRLDTRRADDLGQLARDVDLYWTRRRTLPASLEALAQEGGLGLRIADPDTDASYSYRVLDSTRYELCAAFTTATTVPPGPRAEPFRFHGSGRQCFTIDVAADDRRP